MTQPDPTRVASRYLAASDASAASDAAAKLLDWAASITPSFDSASKPGGYQTFNVNAPMSAIRQQAEALGFYASRRGILSFGEHGVGTFDDGEITLKEWVFTGQDPNQVARDAIKKLIQNAEPYTSIVSRRAIGDKHWLRNDDQKTVRRHAESFGLYVNAKGVVALGSKTIGTLMPLGKAATIISILDEWL